MSTEIETVPEAAVAAHITEDGALEMFVEGVASVRLVGDSARARELAIDEVVALARRRGGPVELVTSGAEGAWRLSVGIDGSVLPMPEAPPVRGGLSEAVGPAEAAVVAPAVAPVDEAGPPITDTTAVPVGLVDTVTPIADPITVDAVAAPAVPLEETVCSPTVDERLGALEALEASAGLGAVGVPAVPQGVDAGPAATVMAEPGEAVFAGPGEVRAEAGRARLGSVDGDGDDEPPCAGDTIAREESAGAASSGADSGDGVESGQGDREGDDDGVGGDVWEGDGDGGAVPLGEAGLGVVTSAELDEELERTVVLPARRRPVHRATLHTSVGTSLTVQGSGVIGRRPTRTPNPVRFPDADASMSNAHAAFTVVADGLLVTDQGSLNGTVVRHDGTVVECAPGQQVHVPRGGRVDLGEQFFIVV